MGRVASSASIHPLQPLRPLVDERLPVSRVGPGRSTSNAGRTAKKGVYNSGSVFSETFPPQGSGTLRCTLSVLPSNKVGS